MPKNDDDEGIRNWRDLFAVWLVGSIAIIIVATTVWSFFVMAFGLEG